jgi:structural maintenance of chromosome 4
VPNSDFSVRRVVHHTSVSNYEINKTEANQKEVVELLQSKGIDLTNHRFLILQGEVEQISLMKPRTGKQDDPGLLEYLEDIIGSYVYKEKIDGLEEEYFKLYEKKREKNDLVNISKMELIKLETAKNVAVEYVRKEKQIYQLMNISHQIARHKSNKEVMRAEGVSNEVMLRKKEEEKKMRERIKDKETLLKNYRKKKQELDEINDWIQGQNNRIKECENRDIQLGKDIEHQLKVEEKFHVFYLLKKQHFHKK